MIANRSGVLCSELVSRSSHSFAAKPDMVCLEKASKKFDLHEGSGEPHNTAASPDRLNCSPHLVGSVRKVVPESDLVAQGTTPPLKLGSHPT